MTPLKFIQFAEDRALKDLWKALDSTNITGEGIALVTDALADYKRFAVIAALKKQSDKVLAAVDDCYKDCNV